MKGIAITAIVFVCLMGLSFLCGYFVFSSGDADEQLDHEQVLAYNEAHPDNPIV